MTGGMQTGGLFQSQHPNLYFAVGPVWSWGEVTLRTAGVWSTWTQPGWKLSSKKLGYQQGKTTLLSRQSSGISSFSDFGSQSQAKEALATPAGSGTPVPRDGQALDDRLDSWPRSSEILWFFKPTQVAD